MTEEKKHERLDSYEEDEIGIGSKLKQSKKAKLSTFSIYLILILVVIASFWLSFSIGKKLLNPPKRMAEMNLIQEPKIYENMPFFASTGEVLSEKYTPEVISEDVVAEKPYLQEEPENIEPKVEEKPKQKKEPKQPSVEPSHFAKKFYKIISGTFPSRSDAEALASNIKTAGFECFIKASGANWIVQSGAYVKKDGADTLSDTLKEKGFESKIVFE